MTPVYCVNKNCPFFYQRTIKGHSNYMCTVRKGKSISKKEPWKIGRLIKIYRLKVCPLETKQKEILDHTI